MGIINCKDMSNISLLCTASKQIVDSSGVWNVANLSDFPKNQNQWTRY